MIIHQPLLTFTFLYPKKARINAIATNNNLDNFLMAVVFRLDNKDRLLSH